MGSTFPAAPSSAGAFRSPCTATPCVPNSCPSEQYEVRSHSMRQKLAPLFLLPTSQVPSSPRPQTCNSEIATWRPQITSSTVSLRTQLFYYGRSGCSTTHLSICYAAPPHRSRAGDGSSAGKGRGGASLPAWKRARELGEEEGTERNAQSPAPEPPGTHFTCFTRAKVLSLLALLAQSASGERSASGNRAARCSVCLALLALLGTRCTCFTSLLALLGGTLSRRQQNHQVLFSLYSLY